MTERKRLIELINKCDTMSIPTDGFIEGFANYLLENGVVLSPVKIGQSIWTSKPFKDGVKREGYITVIEYDNDGFCGFWASFGEIPLSAEFSSEEIGKTVFL